MPSTWTSIVVLLLAIAPGYILVSVWARNRTWRGHSTSSVRVVLQSLAISLVIQIIVAPMTMWLIVLAGADGQDQQPWTVVVWLSITVLLVPCVGGVLVARATDWVLATPVTTSTSRFRTWIVTQALQMSVPPTIWDWAVVNDRLQGVGGNAPRGSFVRIDFSDGTRVGGVFAGDSQAATSPDSHGIFLEQEWFLNREGDFIAPILGSRGIIIPTLDGVRSVRVLGDFPEEPDVNTEAAHVNT